MYLICCLCLPCKKKKKKTSYFITVATISCMHRYNLHILFKKVYIITQRNAKIYSSARAVVIFQQQQQNNIGRPLWTSWIICPMIQTSVMMNLTSLRTISQTLISGYAHLKQIRLVYMTTNSLKHLPLI